MTQQTQRVRVRMAPSPTGHLHVGSLRTALFNVLFARHHNGLFLLRIEDTDKERSKPEYTAGIFEALTWADIQCDETPVIQSERLERHKQVIAQMVQQGTAYYCACTPQELQDRLGSSAAHEGGYAYYDQRCRDLTITPEQSHKNCVVRFKVLRTQDPFVFHDLIHGDITFNNDQFDDFIIMRSDGTPMYNFVVVVDDADMAITHVIRGEDHIPNTPKQIMLYRACGFTVPHFAHLPLILGSQGNRLSKRDAATGVLDYKSNGFLAEALCNYLVRLGWSHGDQELFTRQELIAYFSLEHINKKGAIFDIKKLEWLNSLYIRQKTGAELLELIDRDIDPAFKARLAHWDYQQIACWIDLYKERVKTLKELAQELELVYKRPTEFMDPELAPWVTGSVALYMDHLRGVLVAQEDFSPVALAQVIKQFCTQHTKSLPEVAKPLRVALTGKISSPGIYELLALLGKQESIVRLERFVETIKA